MTRGLTEPAHGADEDGRERGEEEEEEEEAAKLEEDTKGILKISYDPPRFRSSALGRIVAPRWNLCV